MRFLYGIRISAVNDSIVQPYLEHRFTSFGCVYSLELLRDSENVSRYRVI